MIQKCNKKSTTPPFQPCTLNSLTCLLCLNRLSINSTAATEYLLFSCVPSSTFPVGDIGVIASSTCSLQLNGEDQIGCVNKGFEFIGLLGLGGLAFVNTTGLKGCASGLMSFVWVGLEVGVKSSAEGLNIVE
jgi:hypothetical protein